MRGRVRAALVVGAAALAVALLCVALDQWWGRAQRQQEVESRLRVAAQALSPWADTLFSSSSREASAIIGGWAAASGFRITLIRADGVVHADSDTVADLVPQMESHAERPEIVAARSAGEGLSRRHSRTMNRRTTYLALRLGGPAAPHGFLRVAWEGRIEAPPILALLAALLVALTAAAAARWEAARADTAVASRLATWADLPGDEDAETIAEEADRRFRSLKEEQRREVEVTRAALAEVSEGVILLDREGVVRFSNPAAAALLGEGLAIGRALVEAVRAPELLAAVDGVRGGGDARHTTFAAPRGVEVAVRVCPVPHPILSTAVVLRDVRGEKQLERARRALVADLAHELRTPLTVLGGLAEELRDTGFPAEPLDTLERQVRRLRTFAEDLEELAAAEAGRLSLHFEEVDAAAVVGEAAAEHAAAAERAGVTIERVGDAVRLVTDPVRLGQVLANLIDNAVRYNRPGGRVVVRTEPAGAEVRITVEDTGQGIPEDEIPLVFQRFYRVRRGGHGDGSGLGLAIVKHVMRALGGSIQLASVEGEGTTVTLLLPRSR